MNTNNLPALLARMLNAKTEHKAARACPHELNGVLGQTYDMGNKDERKEVTAWLDCQPYFFDPAFAFTVRAQAIAAIHRLTVEGGGAAEQ